MINITKSFTTSSKPVFEFFQNPALGYYIPLYQREYSWDEDNINQLMEDICYGVETLLTDNKAIRFLGTIICVIEPNPTANIDPKDRRAIPTRIDKVIDGQQRISTIAMLSCLLYRRLTELQKQLGKNPLFEDLQKEIKSKLTKLVTLFSLDLQRGSPSRKPIIIRGSIDGWTYDGADKDHYKSEVASFLAGYIRAIEPGGSFPPLPKGTLVATNVRTMNKWLTTVNEAHHKKEEEEKFPNAFDILNKVDQKYIWSYERPEIADEMKNPNSQTGSLSATDRDKVASLVQLFTFIHFLLDRCCFTLIEPESEEWAFDMFQSLNATGTPLTAVETFKPMVVNTTEKDYRRSYVGSEAEKWFEKVDGVLSTSKSAAQKNKITNDFLTTFALVRNGSRLGRQFSQQRQWLQKSYSECKSPPERLEFVHQMGEIATYWSDVVIADYRNSPLVSKLITLDKQRQDRAILCIKYLQDANHQMAHTVLSRFYSEVLRKNPNAIEEFMGACHALAAFFTLWRSAKPNAGLDDVYRRLLLKGDEAASIPPLSWEKGAEIPSLKDLKIYLLRVLEGERLKAKSDWLPQATEYLRYDNVRIVSRFALFVSAHDTMVDVNNPGLMMCARSGTAKFLTTENWNSPDFREIEHIAPREPSSNTGWDAGLYDVSEYFESIGNLTLLPKEINISAGNREWKAKWIYYKHLAEVNPRHLSNLEVIAQQHGVELQSETIEMLKSATVSTQMQPIVSLDLNGVWNKELVKARATRICEIIYDRLIEWLR